MRRLEVFDGVSSAGTGFEVELVGVRLVFVAEGNGCFNVPWCKLGSVRHMACIVHGKPLLQVLRGASVMVAACGAVTQDEDVVKLLLGMHGVKKMRLFNAHAARFRPGGLQRGSLPFLHSAALHVKKFGLANQMACQAEVFSPKKRRLDLTPNEPPSLKNAKKHSFWRHVDVAAKHYINAR